MKSAVRALAAIVLVVSVLAGCSLTYPQPKRYALVFGVARYLDAPFTEKVPPNLEFTDDDATRIASMFNTASFDEVRVRIRDDMGGDGGLGQPTKANLAADLLYFAGKVSANDLFVFYYSGHGVQAAGNTQTTHEWFSPLGSLVSAGPSYTIDWDACVRDDELGSMLAVLPTQRRVVILDSCNSGGLIGDGLEADTVEPVLYGNTAFDGVVTIGTIIAAIGNYATFTMADNGGVSPYHALTIAAAGSDESSWEAGAPYNHGILTYFLLKAPVSGDLNKDGHVTVLEMFALAKAGIDQSWNASYKGTTRVFSPHISGGPIDLVLF